MDEKTQKHIQKSWHKVNGKVYLFEETSYGWQLVIVKAGKNPKYHAFSFYGSNTELLQKVQGFKIKDRIKCRYTSESKLYKGKWYTNHTLKDVLVWKVNEKKTAKELADKKRQADSEYTHSLFSQNSDWLNQGVDPKK